MGFLSLRDSLGGFLQLYENRTANQNNEEFIIREVLSREKAIEKEQGNPKRKYIGTVQSSSSERHFEVQHQTTTCGRSPI